jgi:hypothetical protein
MLQAIWGFFMLAVSRMGGLWDPNGNPTADVGSQWDPDGSPTADVGNLWDPNG